MTDREKLIELLDWNFGFTPEMQADKLADYLINNGVTVQKHGRWRFDVNPYTHRWNYNCSVCGGWCTDEESYCPNCGAKMDLED